MMLLEEDRLEAETNKILLVKLSVETLLNVWT